MATYKTKAIILSSHPYGEHDRIISFFSDAFGRIEARARGVRKIESKLAGHLEPFISTELLLANGRRWDILAGSRMRDSRMGIRVDVVKSAAASVCVEAVKRGTRPFLRERGVYELLDRALVRLERAAGRGEEMLAARFVWELVARVGFAPEMRRCINCKQPLSSGRFSHEGGGVLCEPCAPCDVFADEVSERALRALRAGVEPLDATAQAIVQRFWNHVFEHPIASWNFLKTVAGVPVRRTAWARA